MQRLQTIRTQDPDHARNVCQPQHPCRQNRCTRPWLLERRENRTSGEYSERCVGSGKIDGHRSQMLREPASRNLAATEKLATKVTKNTKGHEERQRLTGNGPVGSQPPTLNFGNRLETWPLRIYSSPRFIFVLLRVLRDFVARIKVRQPDICGTLSRRSQLKRPDRAGTCTLPA